jgi:hypothetical protein
MEKIKSNYVAELGIKYGLPVDAFDKICQITFDNNSDINVYEENGYIVIVGPIIDTSSYYPIEILRHPLWEQISTFTPIILKQFTINITSELGILVATYFVNKFSRTSIVDCIIVGQIVDATRERFAWLGHGCSFTDNIY